MARLERLDLLSRKVFAGKLPGERRSKRRGQSVEFDDYRQYTPGDDLRHIDWNVYARLDRMFIKLFLEEEDLGLHLAIDASASMNAGRPNKLIVAERLAMALGHIGLVNNNRVAATVFGGDALHRFGETRGRRRVQALGQFLLDQVEPRTERGPGAGADFNSAMKAIALTSSGKGVLVVLSDFLFPDGYEEGVRYLAGRGGWDVYFVQLLSPGEMDPQNAGETEIAGDLRLTDAESGSAAEVTVSGALLKQYKRTLERYCEELGAHAASRGIEHVVVRSDTPIETTLLDYLRRRRLLG